MMIVKERRWTAVLAAFAWVALVYLWQAGTIGPEYSAGIDSPEASHIEPARAARTAALPRD